MKKIILILLLFPLLSKSQSCYLGSCEKSQVTAAVIIDNSFKYYEPTGFSGFGVHAGIWIDWLGFTIGGVESKVNAKTPATREAVFTMMGRYQILEDKIQVSPFFTIGTNNCQDVGIRVGYKVYNGIYVGAVGSRLMKYGLSIQVSVNRQ